MRKPDSVISSNTSTIPLARLIEGHSKTFGESFVITHFFNPPRALCRWSKELIGIGAGDEHGVNDK